MRVVVFALAAFLAAGCGDAVAKPKPVTGTPGTAAGGQGGYPHASVADKPVEIVPMTRANAVGALERPAALKRFFESLVRLEAQSAQDDVRIVQFGDSHTASDVETAAIRHSLQSRFGDGGRGFVAIGRPWKRWFQEGVRVGMSNEWAPDKAKVEKGKLTGDGMYGLAGSGIFTRGRAARAWTDITAKTSRAEVWYLEQPAGGAFDVFIDGVRVVRVSTRGERTLSQFRTFDVTENSAHQLEVRAAGDGDVRVYGVALDRAQHGVIYDALGINGAQIRTSILTWNEQHWAEQLRHRAPALVVLAYGTNESVEDWINQQVHERQVVDALGRIARAVPTASCLIMGPVDRAIESKDGWITTPRIQEIIAAQKRVAEAAGCGFYDQMAAMGGEGSMAQWATEGPPRAQRDRVHLTKEGYQQIGNSFASDLMRAYAVWRREVGLPASPNRVVEPPPEPTPPPPATD